MTDLVYVPKKLMKQWLKNGWGLVGSYPTKKEWAVLMHPPGWQSPIKQIEEKKEDNG